MQNGGDLNNLFYNKSRTIIFPAGTQRQNSIQTTLFRRYSDIVCLLCFKYKTTRELILKTLFYPPEMNFNGAHNVLLQCENTLLDCAVRSHSFHCFVISFSPVRFRKTQRFPFFEFQIPSYFNGPLDR